MTSGVKVSRECREVYYEIQLRHKHQYAVFKLSDNMTEVSVEKKGPVGAAYEEFLEVLRAAEHKYECRYGVFDLEYISKEGHYKSKLVFILWAPDTARIEQKMVYTASQSELTATLGRGIHRFIQANDFDDLNWDYLVDECMRNSVD